MNKILILLVSVVFINCGNDPIPCDQVFYTYPQNMDYIIKCNNGTIEVNYDFDSAHNVFCDQCCTEAAYTFLYDISLNGEVSGIIKEDYSCGQYPSDISYTFECQELNIGDVILLRTGYINKPGSCTELNTPPDTRIEYKIIVNENIKNCCP